jgi:TetR/AcrR family transcriptional regulator, copper-responsive repressor
MNKATAPSRPRGRPRGFDRDNVLDRAMRLFWERGYEATSVSELTEAMGITPPTLYSFFGDKKHLFLEAVDRYQSGPGCFAIKALTEEPTAERSIRRLLIESVSSFSNPKGPKGCLVVLGATNCGVESGDVFKALSDRRRAAEAAVHNRIAAGRAAGELAKGTDIDALTGLITATLFGLAIKARDGASRANLRKIVDQTMQTWPRRHVGSD